MDRKHEDATPRITDPAIPRGRPTERTIDREARGLDSDTPHVESGTNARIRSNSASSRTLDDTRVRVNNQDNTGRTQVQMREPNLPRISGGDGRNEHSQSLGTLPQVPQRTRSAYNAPVQTYTPEPSISAPQSRIIRDTSRNDRVRESVQIYSQQMPTPIQMESPRIIHDTSRTRYDAPQANIPQRFEAPQQRFEAPQQRFEAPQQPRFEAPQPRFEAPQQRFEAPQQRFEAPQQRFEAPPQPRFEAPQHIDRPSIGDGGGSRFESHSGGGDGGGGRGRNR
jgi:hypothetical protein